MVLRRCDRLGLGAAVRKTEFANLLCSNFCFNSLIQNSGIDTNYESLFETIRPIDSVLCRDGLKFDLICQIMKVDGYLGFL